jgi:hypothetical protein
MADIRTRLSVFSEKDNADIEIVKQLIPITPSDYHKKGEPCKVNNKLLNKESCWAIESDKKTVDLETCIIELSEFIDTHVESLKKLHFEYDFIILINFIITIHSFNSPIIGMELDFIKKLANIGGKFQIALYYDDEEDNSPDRWINNTGMDLEILH